MKLPEYITYAQLLLDSQLGIDHHLSAWQLAVLDHVAAHEHRLLTDLEHCTPNQVRYAMLQRCDELAHNLLDDVPEDFLKQWRRTDDGCQKRCDFSSSRFRESMEKDDNAEEQTIRLRTQLKSKDDEIQKLQGKISELQKIIDCPEHKAQNSSQSDPSVAANNQDSCNQIDTTLDDEVLDIGFDDDIFAELYPDENGTPKSQGHSKASEDDRRSVVAVASDQGHILATATKKLIELLRLSEAYDPGRRIAPELVRSMVLNESKKSGQLAWCANCSEQFDPENPRKDECKYHPCELHK